MSSVRSWVCKELAANPRCLCAAWGSWERVAMEHGHGACSAAHQSYPKGPGTINDVRLGFLFLQV